VRRAAPGDLRTQLLPPPARPHDAADAATVVRAHLFGQAPEPGAPPTETRLPLALAGVIATRMPEEGYALIGNQGQATQLLHTGSRLANGPRLFQVYVDRVVLEFEGTLQVLRLPKLSAGSGAVLVAAARPAAPAQVLDVAPTVDPRQAELNKGWFEGFYAKPKLVNGVPAGVQLQPMARYQRDYGLKPGDVLTAINGTPIQDMDNAKTAVGQLTDSSVTLTFIRNGVSQTISVSRDD
jgi:general secretion pathway protein C